MFKKLDNKGIYKKDKSNIYGSVVALPLQLETGWNGIQDLELDESYKKLKQVVVAGMGGSALGVRVIQSLKRFELGLPLMLVNDYHLPRSVEKDSLVVLSSYSGGTEEILSVADEVKERGCKAIVLTTGGKLKEMAINNNWPLMLMEVKHNPSNQPRMAIGSNVIYLMGLLSRIGVLDMETSEVNEIVRQITGQQKVLVKEIPEKENPAKILASKIHNKGLVLIAARHLGGAVHVFKNQLNECAKNFAAEFEIPELNHHLMEGLSFPKSLKENIHFVLFDSDLYDDPIRKRIILTEELIAKQGYAVTKIKPESDSEQKQVWETIQFGEFVSFYLAMLNGIDPAPIPWVDWFKEKMKV